MKSVHGILRLLLLLLLLSVLATASGRRAKGATTKKVEFELAFDLPADLDGPSGVAGKQGGQGGGGGEEPGGVLLLLPNHQRWYAKWKPGQNMYTSHTRFGTFGTDLYAQSVLIIN